MKKLILLFVIAACATPITVSAQNKLEKPKDINVAEFDAFKNKAFKIYTRSEEFKAMVDSNDKFKLKDVEEVNKMQEDIRSMQEKTEEMLDQAKKIKPPTKSPKAIKNTKSSGEALKVASENLVYITENMTMAEE